MPKHLTCDRCGKEPADEDYEGNIFCIYHRAKYKLPGFLQDYEEQSKRNEEGEAKLASLRQKIEDLKKIIQK